MSKKEGSFFVFVDRGTGGNYVLLPNARYKTTLEAVNNYQKEAAAQDFLLDGGDRILILNVSKVFDLEPQPGFKEKSQSLDTLIPETDAPKPDPQAGTTEPKPEPVEPKSATPEPAAPESKSTVKLPDDLGDGTGVPEPADTEPGTKAEEPVTAPPQGAGGDDLFGDEGII